MMSIRRPVAKAVSCGNCQQLILRSFLCSLGGPLPTPQQIVPTQRRTFARARPVLNEARDRVQQESHVSSDINDHVLPRNETETEQHVEHEQPESGDFKGGSSAQNQHETSFRPAQLLQSSALPWYLQVQQPVQRHESPVAARQRIPELPEYPPKVLQPLMEHVSVELGIDDLNLLDLRSLDPPPALGSNLLMIVGTARSEKHLHVSADKLCRWLRTQYKFSPYADGLLGRNELKLKLRRKAKRSKLLSAVGTKSTADTELDEGIRTGWVCVNVGRVKDGELPETKDKAQRAEGVIGFGARTDGSNIVVQMMTAEKREELDLENLWTDMLSRADREQQAFEEENGDEVKAMAKQASVVTAPSDSHAELTSSPQPDQSNTVSSNYHPISRISGTGIGQHARLYSTMVRRVVMKDAATTTSVDSPTLLATMNDELQQMSINEASRALEGLFVAAGMHNVGVRTPTHAKTAC